MPKEWQQTDIQNKKFQNGDNQVKEEGKTSHDIHAKNEENKL